MLKIQALAVGLLLAMAGADAAAQARAANKLALLRTKIEAAYYAKALARLSR